jgi:hypothetical protein
MGPRYNKQDQRINTVLLLFLLLCLVVEFVVCFFTHLRFVLVKFGAEQIHGTSAAKYGT